MLYYGKPEFLTDLHYYSVVFMNDFTMILSIIKQQDIKNWVYWSRMSYCLVGRTIYLSIILMEFDEDKNYLLSNGKLYLSPFCLVGKVVNCSYLCWMDKQFEVNIYLIHLFPGIVLHFPTQLRRPLEQLNSDSEM